MMGRTILRFALCIAGIGVLALAGAACGSDDKGERATTETVQQVVECGDEAGVCFDACHQQAEQLAEEIKTVVAQCEQALAQCLEDGLADPVACERQIRECIEGIWQQREAMREALRVCLEECRNAFADCLPVLPDDLVPALPDFIEDCLREGAVCVDDNCRSQVEACMQSTWEDVQAWIVSLSEQLQACWDLFRQGADPREVAECFKEIGQQQWPPDIDLSCIEDSHACLADCGTKLKECLQKGFEEWFDQLQP